MDKTIVRCIASHPQWNEVKASSFTLDVHYPPESYQHLCQPHWRKNGVGVERSIGSIYVRGPVIGGTVVSKDDSGIYSLKASNRIGTANVSISLTVEYAAHVTYLTSPVIAGVGEDVVLECEGDGYPLRQGMVKWFRGNSELKSIVQDQKRAVLRLNASHETGGAYTCVVDNGVGRPNYTTAYLLVRRAPVILPGFDRAAGPIGGKATLRCRAVAVPNAEFTWGIEGDGQMINHNTSKYKFFDTQLDHFTFQSTLTILNLEERDYLPRYRCRVNNKLGLVQSFISLGPPTAPDMPMELEVINVTDKTVSLSWRPGFDGGSDQFFELRYQAVSDSDYKSVNSSGSKIQLSDLKAEHTYRIQIRAINARGRVSEFSTPVLQFRTLDENLQGVYKVATENGSFTKSVMIIILAVLVILVVVNLCLLYCCRRSQRKKKLQEKTEIARTLNHSTDGSGRPIQIYGTMTGTPGANRRPDSNNTNKSELLNEPVSEDNQSVRTIIEVNPNGYMVQHDPNNDFYESNCIADYDMNHDFYSPINKSLLNNGATYAAVPYPEPPYGNGSNSLIYSDISHNNYAIESPSPHRHMMNLRNGGAYTLPMDQQGTFVGGANDYGVVMNGVTANGHYHPQSNSLNLGGNPVSNNNNNYESTLTRSQPPQLRSPRMMSTFVHQPQRSGAGSLMGVSVCDPNEGDLV
uniref:Nephrin n=1 Tax=Ditylenchus dipsaci TaxID=166011 RepID=A0A915DCH9_9BILA